MAMGSQFFIVAYSWNRVESSGIFSETARTKDVRNYFFRLEFRDGHGRNAGKADGDRAASDSVAGKKADGYSPKARSF